LTGDKKLAAIGVGSAVGHGQEPWSRVLVLEVLVVVVEVAVVGGERVMVAEKA
jgi:hypothetical protein